MTHTQTQGADGAGTKTAGQIAAERVCHEEQMVIWSSEMAERLAMGDWLREHMSYEDKLGFYADLSEGLRDIVGAAFDLASPRADSAERTGGTDRAWPASYQETFDAIAAATKIQAGMISVSVRDFYRALSYPDRPATPAPATPPGVPDSLRALSEAATQGELNTGVTIGEWGDTICAGPTWTPIARFERQEDAEFFAAAGSHVRTFLASHPAGQSAGSGEETVWTHPHLPSVAKAAVAEAQAINAALAPDSTRTGQGEAAAITEEDLLQFARSKRWYVRGGTSVPQADGGWHHPFSITADSRDLCEWINALAARPAAPEAQGAWFPISTAPPNKAVQVYVPNHDYYGNEGVYAGMLVDMGTGQRWMTFAWAMGRDMCGEDRPTHWRPLPAPPSSSGQGAR